MANDNLPPDYDDGSQDPLGRFTTNLTDSARKGKLDPVIGRDDEIRRCMQILARRTKNNPVLVGDPGVGKTAIVEGLAQRIVSGDIPDTLANKELLVLDIALVLAGAKYQGEFEERLKNILKSLRESPDKYILFIDELHVLVGAGSGGRGAMDAANILKPALARGELRTIGATTIREYRQYIEKDQALERRFQPVFVGEPNQEDAIAILRGIKEKYELHHGIRITDDAIIAAVTLSTRYITDRFLPDKAVDLIDEATSTLKIETQSMPVVLDKVKRRLTQLEIEAAALKKEKSENAKSRLKDLQTEIDGKKKESEGIESRWRTQKGLIASIQKAKKELDSARAELEKAERLVDLEKAAQIKFGQVPTLEKNLHEAEKALKRIPESDRLLREEVTSEDIAAVVSRWTGIPATKLLLGESEKLEHLEDELRSRVVGQDAALQKVANSVRRSRAGLSAPNRPIGSFLFLGPTGVGKTETAKALAESLFNDENAIVRIDMSEYSEPHTISRLIGAPPGYVGYEEGGQLTEAVRRRPYCVVLFDEIEKASQTIYNVFLQILDDGRLTDGNGRTVDFRNCIIIMTSNVEESDLSHVFRPEFLNRLDNVIVFNKLSEKVLESIVDVQLHMIEERLAKQGLHLIVSEEARAWLAKKGFDPLYGARPLRRLIETSILDEAAMLIVEGKKKNGDTITVTTSKTGIAIK